MIYIVQAIAFTAIILLYIEIAARFGIIDKPNKRGSHSRPVVRGGGIIFPIAALWYYLLYGLNQPYFIVGLFIISLISFLDDIYSLSSFTRIIVQFLCACLLLIQLSFISFSWIWGPLMIVLVVGWINAFNFMDGINGITAFYGLVSFGSIYYVNSTLHIISAPFLAMIGIALLVFTFFNARYYARVFAGDIGSISLAYILAFLMIELIIKTGRYEYILFFSVYGVDTTATIFERLIKGENIFEPHRSHLYQVLTNENNFSQVVVALGYSVLQIGINIFIIYCIREAWLPTVVSTVLILGLLASSYLFMKLSFVKN